MTSLGPIDKRVLTVLVCHTSQCFFFFLHLYSGACLCPCVCVCEWGGVSLREKVEVWLNRVLDSMRSTVRHEMTEAVAAYEDKPREQWLFDYPAQVNEDRFKRQRLLPPLTPHPSPPCSPLIRHQVDLCHRCSRACRVFPYALCFT